MRWLGGRIPLIGFAALGNAFNDLDELIPVVTVAPGVLHEFTGTGQDRALPRGPGDRDAPAAAELQHPLIPEQSQRPQHRVGVHIQHGGQVPGRRQSLAGADLAVGDRPADLGTDLIVERQRIVPAKFDIQHDASQTSTMPPGMPSGDQLAWPDVLPGDDLPPRAGANELVDTQVPDEAAASADGQVLAAEAPAFTAGARTTAFAAEARADALDLADARALAAEALAAEALAAEALAAEALAAEALIAEARAHARRRRRRVALAVVAGLVVAAAGAFVAYSALSTSPVTKTHPHTVPLAARTGVVTGHLEACNGLGVADPPPVTPGTVTVLRGKETWKPIGDGTLERILPTTVVAREYISNNYSQLFRFVLPPGQYLLAGSYYHGNVTTAWPISITAGKVLHQDVPDMCS
jgi:hypothetical protein